MRDEPEPERKEIWPYFFLAGMIGLMIAIAVSVFYA